MLNTRIEALECSRLYTCIELVEYMVAKIDWSSPISYDQYLWTSTKNY